MKPHWAEIVLLVNGIAWVFIWIHWLIKGEQK